ncbi:MAG: hypothetical protein QOG53_121 [Frankiales bacterium]|jgi:hypothetical protein|nr:hypothetical protein [Frankiales bacterium]
MADDKLRREFNAAFGSDDDLDVDRMLARVRGAAAQRSRRRRWFTAVAPLAAAALSIAVLLLVRVALPDNSAPKTLLATPTPSVSPALQTLHVGQWYRHVVNDVTTPSGVVHVGGVWVIRLSSTTRGVIEIHSSPEFNSGALRYDAGRDTWVVTALTRYCGGKSGTYDIEERGTALILTHVDDPCTVRAATLDNNVFLPLTDPSQLMG